MIIKACGGLYPQAIDSQLTGTFPTVVGLLEFARVNAWDTFETWAERPAWIRDKQVLKYAGCG